MAGDGAVAFARFAYPPNALGYCGPVDHGELLEYGAAGVADGGLVQLARGFAGAWPYLELIAHANAITDPLDARVVEAYWIGNDLLEAARGPAFGESLRERFRARVGGDWNRLIEPVPAGVVPHHSFHVFGVYPWVGLLRTGHVAEPLRVLDRCRIRSGTVVSVDADTAVVRFRPLTWDGRRLGIGEESDETVTWAKDGLGFLRDLRPGDRVALHWDWICDRLSPSRDAALGRHTRHQLDLVNATPHPGPAAVLG